MMRKYFASNQCVCCGTEIPEGMQVCYRCLNEPNKTHGRMIKRCCLK